MTRAYIGGQSKIYIVLVKNSVVIVLEEFLAGTMFTV